MKPEPSTVRAIQTVRRLLSAAAEMSSPIHGKLNSEEILALEKLIKVAASAATTLRR